MGTWRVRGGAVLLVAALLAPAAGLAADRRAVVVGIDHYPKGSRWRDLTGAVNDARAMADLLRARYGFEVTLLVEAEATRPAVLEALRAHLVEGAGPGVEALLFFAGHGSQVRNSLSPEADQRDETLVAQDGADIRDFELNALLVRSARAGARVTALFDSCHSAGVTRGGHLQGRGRAALPDETDRPVAAERPSPAEAGVVTLTAVQADQIAYETTLRGQPHGRFTAALLLALGAAPADEPAAELFARVQARLRAGAERQDPSFGAPPQRLEEPLLLAGPAAAPSTRRRRPVVAAARVRPDGVELLGGPATGISRGAVLVRRGGPGPPLRLDVVEELGPTRTVAQVTTSPAGTDPAIAVGELFELERWAPPRADRLPVDVGEVRPAEEVAALARALQRRPGAPRVRWVDDPAVEPPDWLVELRGGAWSATGPAGAAGALSAAPSPAEIEALVLRLSGGAGRPPGRLRPPSVFVRLPASPELLDRLGWERRSAAGARAPAGAASYALVGRAGPAGPEYAAVRWSVEGGRPGPEPSCSADAQLPVRTRWAAPAEAGEVLSQDVARIAKVQAWLDRAPPPDEPPLPYHLELRRGGATVATERRPGEVAADASLELWLVRDAARLETYRGRRHVYLLVIDCRGAIQVAGAADGPVGAFPPEDPDARATPALLVGTARLDGTAGPYTFVLVASAEPIEPATSLQQAGWVREGAPIKPERWWVERVRLVAR